MSSPNNLLNSHKCHGKSIKKSVHNFTKIRWVTDLSVKPEVIKVLENNRDTHLYNCNGKGLSRNDTKARTISNKMFDTFNYLKVLNLCI